MPEKKTLKQPWWQGPFYKANRENLPDFSVPESLRGPFYYANRGLAEPQMVKDWTFPEEEGIAGQMPNVATAVNVGSVTPDYSHLFPATPPTQPVQQAIKPQAPTDFDEVPTLPQFSPYVTPEQVEETRKQSQRIFYNAFAETFHKAPKSNFREYKNYVENLPEAKNPLIRAYVLQLARENMPSNIRREYATNQQRYARQTEMQEQLRQAVEFNQIVEDMKRKGELPATAYYDPKSGQIAHDRQLGKTPDMTRYAKIRFDVARKNYMDAVKGMADEATLTKLQAEMDNASQLLDRAYGVGGDEEMDFGGIGASAVPQQQGLIDREVYEQALREPTAPGAQIVIQLYESQNK